MYNLKVDNAKLVKPQPEPDGKGFPILFQVIQDLISRAEDGVNKYGEMLMPNNGRDPLIDAYQEALDLCMYLRQAIEERNENKKDKHPDQGQECKSRFS